VQDELGRVLNGLQEIVALSYPKKQGTFSFCTASLVWTREVKPSVTAFGGKKYESQARFEVSCDQASANHEQWHLSLR
jgi:hypothetical protein